MLYYSKSTSQNYRFLVKHTPETSRQDRYTPRSERSEIKLFDYYNTPTPRILDQVNLLIYTANVVYYLDVYSE